MFDLLENGFDQRMTMWLAVDLGGHRHSWRVRTATRLRIATLHHSIHRGPAEPALPPRVLHHRGVR